MHKPYHPCRYCQLSKMADDKQEEGKLARLTERLTAGAPPTPEQIEESAHHSRHQVIQITMNFVPCINLRSLAVG
jgi:hypothetical protein